MTTKDDSFIINILQAEKIQNIHSSMRIYFKANKHNSIFKKKNNKIQQTPLNCLDKEKEKEKNIT